MSFRKCFRKCLEGDHWKNLPSLCEIRNTSKGTILMQRESRSLKSLENILEGKYYRSLEASAAEDADIWSSL